jgi:hypothetical protein
VRPVKKGMEKSIGWMVNKNPLDWFSKKAKDIIGT